MIRAALRLFCLLTLIEVINAQNSISIEFIDTIANQKTGVIGFKGNAVDGHIFFETPNSPDVRIEKGNLITQGTLTAAKYYRGLVEFDSVKSSSIADSTKKIPNNSVTNAKISNTLKIKDENIDSISWDKIKGIPDGFKDKIDNVGSTGNKIDSAKIAQRADSLGQFPANKYALKTEIRNNVDSLGGFPSTAYVKTAHRHDSLYYTKSETNALDACGFSYKTGYETIEIAPNATTTLHSKDIVAPENGYIIVIASANILNNFTQSGVIILKVQIDGKDIGLNFAHSLPAENFATCTINGGSYLTKGNHTITLLCNNSSDFPISSFNGSAISYFFSKNSM